MSAAFLWSVTTSWNWRAGTDDDEHYPFAAALSWGAPQFDRTAGAMPPRVPVTQAEVDVFEAAPAS
jgi:hypothetical protein